MRKYTVCIIVILFALLPVAAMADNLRITFIDVGQGDAALLQCGGQSMLVDTGSKESVETVLAFLDKTGIIALDYVVGTHPHADHIGGMYDVLTRYDVSSVWMPRVKNEIQEFDDTLLAVKQSDLKINAPVVGNEFMLGDAVITILAPISDAYEDIDDYSIVFRVDHGRNSFLFVGDAGRVSEDEMLASRSDIDVNVLKVSNHGANTSSTKAFLAATTPSIAIISCGIDNKEGVPEESTIRALEEEGALVLRTDVDGNIQIDSDRTILFYDQELALEHENEWYGRINTKNVNVRKGASKRTDRVAYLDEGAAVRVLLTVESDTEDTWYLIEYNDIRGYVLSDFVEPVNPLASSGEEGTVTDDLDDYFMPYDATVPVVATVAPGETDRPIATNAPIATIPSSGAVPTTTIRPLIVGSGQATQEPEAVSYIGNIISKIFHRTTCDSLPSTKNQVVFDTRIAAISDGYIPCLNCNP